MLLPVLKQEAEKQKFDGEGVRFSFASKEKQKTCVCRRKSCERNEKQRSNPPLPGSQLRWRAVRKAHSENRRQAGENE